MYLPENMSPEEMREWVTKLSMMEKQLDSIMDQVNIFQTLDSADSSINSHSGQGNLIEHLLEMQIDSEKEDVLSDLNTIGLEAVSNSEDFLSSYKKILEEMKKDPTFGKEIQEFESRLLKKLTDRNISEEEYESWFTGG